MLIITMYCFQQGIIAGQVIGVRTRRVRGGPGPV